MLWLKGMETRMARLSLFGFLLAFTACGASDGEDTADTSPPRDCSEPTGSSAAESGVWEFSIDEQITNTCENVHGKGVHIHVGESTRVDLTRDGSCIDGQDAEGDGVPIDPNFSDDTMIYTEWTGSTDGSSMTMDGWIEVPVGGTCFLGIQATITADMISSTEATYRIDADIDVSQEGSCSGGKLKYIDGRWACDGGTWAELADACDITMGDEEYHSLPQMPCTQAWSGTGTLTQ